MQKPIISIFLAVRSVLKRLRPGDRIQLWVPVEWGYGPNRGYGVAKPDELLVFDIELVRVNSVRGGEPDYSQPPFLSGIVEYKKQLQEHLSGKSSEPPKKPFDDTETFKTGL
jgi:hypothetical protein